MLSPRSPLNKKIVAFFMHCRQCKRVIEADDIRSWRFCPDCGESLTDEKIFFSVQRFFQSKRNLAFFLLFNFFVIASFSYLFFHSRMELSIKNQEIHSLIQKKQVVQVEAEYQSEIFPITYWGENQRIATLKLDSPLYGKLRVVSQVEGLTEEETKTIDVRPGGSIAYIGPDITPQGLANLADSRKATFKISVFQIQDDATESKVFEDSSQIFFYSRGDIIWSEEGVDNSKYMVRWINKDRPEIADIVRKAADHMKEVGGSVNGMVGQLEDEEEIRRQMEAIFLAMVRDYKIRYVFAPFSYDNSQVQHVKFPEEVIKSQSGLCVELSLLMAASLENIGLQPVVVLTEDHAWAGVELGPRSGKYVFIETTALDKTAQEAVKIGQDNWKLLHDESIPFRIINVKELRAEKLVPLRY